MKTPFQLLGVTGSSATHASTLRLRPAVSLSLIFFPLFFSLRDDIGHPHLSRLTEASSLLAVSPSGRRIVLTEWCRLCDCLLYSDNPQHRRCCLSELTVGVAPRLPFHCRNSRCLEGSSWHLLDAIRSFVG